MADLHAVQSREQISEQVRAKIAASFDVPAARINDKTVVDDIDGWDSTTHVGLIIDLEEALGIEFDVEQVSAFENVGELIDVCTAMVNKRG